MYLTVKQQLKHLSKEEYLLLKELCHMPLYKQENPRYSSRGTNKITYSILEAFLVFFSVPLACVSEIPLPAS